jgi:adenylate cyclase
MIERNTGLPPERRIEFRVGIHLGDVIEENDGDLMGDAVNIAARLEGVAKPGKICLSEQAYWQVKGRLDLKLSDLGLTSLKNIAEPVRVYSLEAGESVEAGSNPPASGKLGPPHLSIVVLPFANLGGDPEQEYFADGVTENLTTELSRIRNSFVIARNTAFTYNGKSIDAKEIGKQLGVRYMLEGSVQRDQSRVRVNAQLVDAESGAHLWADRFEEDMADLFKLQDHVVARLASGLGWALRNAEAEKGARSKNPDVIDLTMRGRDLLRRGAGQPPDEHRKTVIEARGLFDRALQIDPNDADALIGIARTYFTAYLYGLGEPGTDYDAKVLVPTNRALAIEPDNVRAYYTKAQYLEVSGRPGEAIGLSNAGLAVDPNFVPLYVIRAASENSLGQYEQARADVQRGMSLSPHDTDTSVFHVIVGDAEISLGHFDAATDEYRKAIDVGPRLFFQYTNLAASYAHAGKMEEAKVALAEARRLNPAITVKWMKEHTPNLPAVFDGLRKAGLPEE